jgi:uncharacterized protein
MQAENDIRPRLRRQLKAAVRDHDRIAVSALRDGIAALDNAEAVEPDQDVPTQGSEHVAGGVVCVGAAEVERRILDPESQRSKTTPTEPPQRPDSALVIQDVPREAAVTARMCGSCPTLGH